MNEIYELLQKLNIEVAYHHFKKATAPPFVVYYRNSSDNFVADDVVYKKINIVRIELYTTFKNEELENELERLLDEAEIIYEVVAESYIESEKIYQVVYEISN